MSEISIHSVFSSKTEVIIFTITSEFQSSDPHKRVRKPTKQINNIMIGM